jgi:hypothetical protein
MYSTGVLACFYGVLVLYIAFVVIVSQEVQVSSTIMYDTEYDIPRTLYAYHN